MNKYKYYITTAAIAVACFVTDIFTKLSVEKNIAEGQIIDILGSKFFQLTKLYNTGGVFGILRGQKTFFLIVSIIVLIVLVTYYIREKHKSDLFAISMGLVFSGALGNIHDRVIGRPGVVDFLYIGFNGGPKWPAFNIADSCIVIGAGLLIIVFYKQEKAIKEARLAAQKEAESKDLK